MTSIEWTHRPGTKGESWNPIVGCSITSPGCTNCYAMGMATRIQRMTPHTHYRGTTAKVKGKAVWTGSTKLAPDRTLEAPLRATSPRTYFVNSMGDLFHESVPDEWIDRVFAVMAVASQHTFIVLTKRAQRMREFVTNLHKAVRVMQARLRASPAEIADIEQAQRFARQRGERDNDLVMEFPHFCGSVAHPKFDWKAWPLPNVWLGVSAERQPEWDNRVEHLGATPAAVRVVSIEPMLGEIDCGNAFDAPPDGSPYSPIDWVIVGGESGPDARPMHPDWARSIRDQCAQSKTPFFFKQWGEWHPDEKFEAPMNWAALPNWLCLDASGNRVSGYGGRNEVFMQKVGKSRAGHLLDGAVHFAWPDDNR